MNKSIKLYNEDNIKIWGDYLTHVDIKFNGYKPKIQNDSKHYAVIIEPRQHLNLALVMKSTLYYLNENESPIKWGLQIFHGTNNEDYVKNITKDWVGVEYFNMGVRNLSNIEHSEYMETSNFWKNVKGDKALIFQTDSLLLRSGVDEFLPYDYVGAPWRKPKENQWVGNGGLSLRTVSKMIEICENNPVTEQIWEDIYFMKHMKGIGVADVETASKFSMEDVFSKNPLGVHNPIRHIEPKQLKKVLFKK
jgi:hypothetical protein